jgi:cell wall-associated NlpC family hydrolase
MRRSQKHRLAPAGRTPSAPRSAAQPTRRASAARTTAELRRLPLRRHSRIATVAIGASAGLVASLMFALPAEANPSHAHFAAQHEKATSSASQVLTAGGYAGVPLAERDSYVASDLAAKIASEAGVDSATAAVIADGLTPGPRLAIVETALQYLGDQYELGGASHGGIDCSGLTMVAYASAGVPLGHLVSAQDAIGTVVSAGDARPGDLVVFDSHEHIGLYLGGNLVLHAPDYGRPVQIESLDAWSGIGHHFTRILAG